MTVAHYLGLAPKWVHGTTIGGCSFVIDVRHAAAAITSGLGETVLITHGESGRFGVGRTRNVVPPASLAGSLPFLPAGGVGRWGRRLFHGSGPALNEYLWALWFSIGTPISDADQSHTPSVC